MKLTNKVALVLGGVKGIGRAIALALAGHGVKLAVTYYDWDEEFSKLKEELEKTGVEYLILKQNLLETESIPVMVKRVADKFGGIDILLNNIERGGWPVVHGKYIKEQWDLEFETTLRAKWWVFDSVLSYLKNSKDGVVINFSSIAGIVGRSGPASLIFNDGYAAANRGVLSLTETFARLGAPYVRVNEIMLGIFDTRHGLGTRGWSLLKEDQKKAILDHTLLKRTGSFDDIIKAVLFIIRDAPYMTGSVIRLDGGYVLAGETVCNMPEGVV